MANLVVNANVEMIEAGKEVHTPEPYQYQPLLHPSDAIRLLILEPHQDIESPVKCSLIQASLVQYVDDMIDHYTALSYVWGDAAMTKPVLVDGKALNVTVNLELALRYMRDATRKRVIWADAICINQKDDEEKSRQVAQMNEVYATAQHTVIFLGEPTSETETGFNSLRESPEEDFKPNVETAFEDLLSRPWFTRIWIYQELMSSRDPWLQCGRQRIRWDKFYALIEDTQQLRKTHSCWETFFHMASDRKRFRGWGDDLTGEGSSGTLLLQTLVARRGLGVFDARDMLFAHHAILGLAAGTAEQQKLLEIDYTKSCGEVYADVAKYHMLHNDFYPPSACDSLNIFSYIENFPPQQSQSKSSIPSWAPDWTLPGLRKPYCRLREGLSVLLHPKATKLEKYKNMPTSFFWAEPTLFVTVGVSAGTLLAVSSVITEQYTAQERSSLHRSTIGILFSVSRRWLPEVKAMYKTGLCDLPQCYNRDLTLIGTHEGRYESAHATIERTQHLVFDDSGLLRNLFYHALADNTIDTIYPRFLYGRKLALLKRNNGDLALSLVPHSARVGDEIFWSIADLKLPYVVRPRQIDEARRVAIDSKFDPNSRYPYDVNHFEFVGEGLIDEAALGELEHREKGGEKDEFLKDKLSLGDAELSYFVLH